MKNTYILFKYLYHPKTGKLNFTNHFKEKLFERKRKFPKDLYPSIKEFKFHEGGKRCKEVEVIDRKILKGYYPNSHYLYDLELNLILVIDLENKNIITCLENEKSRYYR
jgi:hypothetical protein